MVEACNKQQLNRTEPITMVEMRSMSLKRQPSKDRYRDLFLKVKGNLVLAAAKVGQEALVPANQAPTPFFRYFDESLQKQLTDENKASWRRLFEDVNVAMQYAIRISNKLTNANVRQEPVYEFRDFAENIDMPIVEPTAVAHTFDNITEDYLLLMKRADQQYRQRDYQFALELYQKALNLKYHDYKAKQGVYLCRAMLGQMNFKEIELEELCSLLDNMARLPEFQDQPFAFAQYLYGVSLIRGKGNCKRDLQKAESWLKISYKNGIEGACHVWERVDRSRTNKACQTW